jgi:glycosyltransferase involved in cell wall biosynthesis
MSDAPGGRVIAGMPAFNEAKYIGSLVLGARQYVDDVIVIDDGSTDNTAELAELAGAVVVRHEGNQGYGAAIQSILEAARQRDPDVLVIFDADAQHTPEDIPKLADAVKGGLDFVIGSRERQRRNIPFYRRLGQRVISHSANILAESALSDTESGFRAFSRKALQTLNLQEQGMAISAETVIEASKLGLKVGEVPISVSYSGDSSTLNPVSHGLGVLTKILVMISERKPFFFFGLGGIVVITLGLIAGIITLRLYGQFHVVSTPWTLLSVLLLTLGSFSFFTGLILRAISSIIHTAISRDNR